MASFLLSPPSRLICMSLVRKPRNKAKILCMSSCTTYRVALRMTVWGSIDSNSVDLRSGDGGLSCKGHWCKQRWFSRGKREAVSSLGCFSGDKETSRWRRLPKREKTMKGDGSSLPAEDKVEHCSWQHSTSFGDKERLWSGSKGLSADRMIWQRGRGVSMLANRDPLLFSKDYSPITLVYCFIQYLSFL